METVGRLADLESLDLDHTKVSDAGIAKLAGLTRLTDLELDSVELTDAGVAHLACAAQPEASWICTTRW